MSEAENRLIALVEASDMLADSLDYATTLQRVADLVVPALGDWCAVDVIDEHGQLQRLAVAHVNPSNTGLAHELHRRYPARTDAPGGIWQSILTHQPQLHPVVGPDLLALIAQDAEHLKLLNALEMHSIMFVPLIARSQAIGALMLVASDVSRQYTTTDLRWASMLARRAALSIDNARLYTAAQLARQTAEAAERRASFLADVSHLLATSLNYRETLTQVARLAVGHMADYCILYLGTSEQIDLVIAAHANPAKESLVYAVQQSYLPDPANAESLVSRVLRTGEPAMLAEITDAFLSTIARSDDQLALFRALGPRSGIAVPLTARGQTLGVILFVAAESGRRYTQSDQDLAVEVGRRAGLAVDNARLYTMVAEQREWFRTTLASIGDAVIVTDSAGHVRFLNGVAETLTGWPEAEALGLPLTSIFRIINEETRAPGPNPIDEILRKGGVVSLSDHTVLCARDGREIPIDDSAAPIRVGDAPLSGVIIVFRDVTERRQADQDLRRSRDQLAIIVGGSTDGITIQNRSGALIYSNSIAAHLCGFATTAEMLATPAQQILGHFAIFDETGAPFPLEHLPGRLALSGQPSRPQTLRFRALPGGAERWSIVSATPVYDELGRIELAINIFRDITAQKRAEQTQRFLSEASVALAASLDREATLQTIADLAVPTLADWCIVDMLQADGSLKTVIVSHKDPEKLELGWEVVRRYPLDPNAPYGTGHVIRTGLPELVPDVPDGLFESLAQDPDHPKLLRELGFHSYMCVPLIVGGRALGTIALVSADTGHFGPDELAVAEEFARRVATALDNTRHYAEAQAAISARDQFLSIASHELKTPLTALLGYISILQRRLDQQETLSPRNRKALQVIAAQGDRLNSLIQSLLDLSRLQTGQLSIISAPLDLGALAQEAVEEIEPTLDLHPITIARPDAPVIIQGDQLRLAQVIQNLLQNAVKYSPDGGRITVRVTIEHTQACLIVQDQGIGIPPNALPQLFRRFYRASNVDGSKISGMGMGLYIVREIMALHGGSVDVESKEGHGSTFTLCFPNIFDEQPQVILETPMK